jgi:hypothetical protein
MTVSVVFERDIESRKVIASLLNDGVPESDVRVKWARLTLRYTRQIAEATTLEFNPFIEDGGARIDFIIEDEEEYDDDDDDWMVGTPFASADTSDIGSDGYQIGFGLETYGATNRIGGLTTPSVVLASTIYQQLLKARAKAA